MERVESAIKEWVKYENVADFFSQGHALDPLLNILHGGQVDFRTLNDRNARQRDHIFPKAKLESLRVPPEKINDYANMRLLGAISNILKCHADPASALASFPAQALEDDYLIPNSLLDYSTFDQFLDERRRVIRRAVDPFLD